MFSKTVILDRATDEALVGSGAYPQPGEISLSYNRVLFLDELPEFKRGVLAGIRDLRGHYIGAAIIYRSNDRIGRVAKVINHKLKFKFY